MKNIININSPELYLIGSSLLKIKHQLRNPKKIKESYLNFAYFMCGESPFAEEKDVGLKKLFVYLCYFIKNVINFYNLYYFIYLFIFF